MVVTLPFSAREQSPPGPTRTVRRVRYEKLAELKEKLRKCAVKMIKTLARVIARRPKQSDTGGQITWGDRQNVCDYFLLREVWQNVCSNLFLTVF